MSPSHHKDLDLARLTRRPAVALVLLALLGAAFFVPGLGRVHLFDWDEANFAEAAREMLPRWKQSEAARIAKPDR